MIGAAAYGLVSDVSSPMALQPSDGARAHVSFFSGGARPAIVLAPAQIVHISIGLLAGAGGAF